MSLRGSRAQIFHAELPENVLMGPVRHLDLSGVESDTTAAKGLYPGGSQRVHSLRHRRRRGLDPQERPPPQLSGCTELWLPPALLPGCAFVLVCISQYFFFTKALVHVRHACRSPSPDSKPFEVSKSVYAFSSRPRFRPRWWIPAGGRLLVLHAH